MRYVFFLLVLFGMLYVSFRVFDPQTKSLPARLPQVVHMDGTPVQPDELIDGETYHVFWNKRDRVFYLRRAEVLP